MSRLEELRRTTPPGFLRNNDVEGLIPSGSLAFRSTDGGLTVLVSEEHHSDGFTYLHVSFSRRSRTPSYEDLDRVRKLFIGEDRESVQVFPPKAEYVNFHAFTLHLWHRYEGRIFPGGRS